MTRRDMAMGMLGALAAVVLGGWWGDHSVAQGEEGLAPTTLNLRKARVKVKSVSALATKADGKSWDATGNEPDLYVIVSDGDSKERTKSVSDSLLAKIDHTTSIEVEVGDQLSIEVWDEDLMFDDEVGKRTIVVTRDILESGILQTSFGRVDNLILVFE